MIGRKKRIHRVIRALLILTALAVAAVLGIHAWVQNSTKDRILSAQMAAQLADVDCVLVLGCKVMDDGTPSDMLYDRLRQGLELYALEAAPKLLMSGDHGQREYDEVSAMKQFAVDAQIPADDVFMDHAGFSTYESVYRAKEVFQARKILIVTQEYHLYRALYIADQLGLEAYGVAADYRTYSGQTGRDIREILAQVKDMFTCIFRPEPTFLGEAIPIWGSGSLTDD